jgi:hypothetical protein
MRRRRHGRRWRGRSRGHGGRGRGVRCGVELGEVMSVVGGLRRGFLWRLRVDGGLQAPTARVSVQSQTPLQELGQEMHQGVRNRIREDGEEGGGPACVVLYPTNTVGGRTDAKAPTRNRSGLAA